MGMGTFWCVGNSVAQVRRYWHGHHALKRLRVSRRLDDGRVIYSGEADCGLVVTCDGCGETRCVGCGQQVSIDLSGGAERVTCLGCWEPEDA